MQGASIPEEIKAWPTPVVVGKPQEYCKAKVKHLTERCVCARAWVCVGRLRLNMWGCEFEAGHRKVPVCESHNLLCPPLVSRLPPLFLFVGPWLFLPSIHLFALVPRLNLPSLST